MNFLKKPAAKPAPQPAAIAVPQPPVAVSVGVPKPAPVAGSGIEAKPAASKPAPLRAITISQEAIAQAAYFRWQRFGGDEATNWRLAEQELRDEAKRLGILV